MKKIIITAILMACTFTLDAQVHNYGRVDFEIGLQTPLHASSHRDKTNGVVPGFYFESRWQAEPVPIDLGFHVGLSVVRRKYEGGHENYRAVPIMATADYQFGRGTRVNPYVGLGIGLSSNTIVNYKGGDSLDFALSPRAGVRLFRLMNVSVGYLATHKDYSRLYCNLGFYF